ncbi:RNA polymerase sigma factor [Actinocorallia longicatena]|uniref:RNA polymerase sigma factor n=1 Tax=Actinocorallia longicatena TaxID=111803 RepID=A0ABP6Q0I0_9ACTN
MNDPDPSTSEEELAEHILRAQKGDEGSFSVLYTRTQPRVLRYLRLLVGDDAEDVASEVWLQVARDLRGFSGDGPGFRGWTATIARNRAMDHLRRVRRRPSVPVEIDRLVSLVGAEDAFESTHSIDAAIRLIGMLPRDQAEAVLLRVVLDLDAESTARVLGKRSGAVRMATSRGLKRLAKILESTGEHRPPARVTRVTAGALEDRT